MPTLKQIVEESDTPQGKAFDLVVQSLIILSLIAFSIETLPDLAPQTQPDAFGSIFDCLWWAVVTLTTVGYGDVYPITVGGRIFTFLMLLIGIGIISVPAGLVASALPEARELEEQGERDRRD